MVVLVSASPAAIATVAGVVPGFLLLAGYWWGATTAKRDAVRPTPASSPIP